MVQDPYFWQFDSSYGDGATAAESYPSRYSHLHGKWLRAVSCSVTHCAAVTVTGKLLVWGTFDRLSSGNQHSILMVCDW